jgi:hypothetical protein
MIKYKSIQGYGGYSQWQFRGVVTVADEINVLKKLSDEYEKK